MKRISHVFLVGYVGIVEIVRNCCFSLEVMNFLRGWNVSGIKVWQDENLIRGRGEGEDEK